MKLLRSCWAILRMQVISRLQYRLASWAGMTTNAFWGIVHVIIIVTFYRYGQHADAGADAGMSLAQAVSYVWLVQICISLLGGFTIDSEVRERIANGDVGIELCRPLDLYAHWLARGAALRIAPFLMNLAPIMAFAMLMPEPYRLQPPASLAGLLASLLAVAMGLLLACACMGLTYVLLMKITWGQGPTAVFLTIVEILSGAYLPLQLWPNWAQRFLLLQPFAGIIDMPFRLYVGTLEPGAIWQVLALQGAWAVTLVVIGWVSMQRMLTRLVIQGG